MKRIYLEGRARGWSLHSLYDEIINFPPDGYKFVTNYASEGSDKINPLRSISGHLFNSRLDGALQYFRPLSYYLYYATKSRHSLKAIDLTYSSQHLVFRKEPWVVDLEHVGALAAYGRLEFFKSFLEKILSSPYCRKIIPWSEAGKQSLFLNLNCKKFEKKIETVRLAVHPKKFTKKYDTEKIKLLFVGTVNTYNIETSFDMRGGKEVLAAFERLSYEYPNLELTMRSIVSPVLRKKYRHLSKKIRIIDYLLPWKELENEFMSADIFLFPGHTTPGMTLLDAMSYELPVITTNVWGNSELIENGKNGLLIEKSKRVPYYMHSPQGVVYYTSNYLKAIKEIDSDIVNELTKKLRVIVEDPHLRRKLGQNARKEIEIGKFSIKKRNKALKRIFDEAATN